MRKGLELNYSREIPIFRKKMLPLSDNNGDILIHSKIKETLELIKKQIGINLTLCTYYSGVRGGRYFNVILKENIYESPEYLELQNLASLGILKKVSQNGSKRTKRVAIHFN